MARQFSLPYQMPPDTLLAAATDAAGRTGAYVSLRNCLKAWIVAKVNQGNAAQVTFSVLQAKDSAGGSSKAIATAPIWANQDTAAADGNAVQTAGATFQTSAALKDKRVIFELTPDQVLDIANGFNHVALQTSASNAGNITSAELFVLPSYQGAAPPTDRV